ncbi:MAG TPA: Na+/H+ antiporter NhaA [Corynebacterium nuruki]|uniref:Na(+)/H(+) antiporter NhaA n=1 Tax=Corynebacterium nuruki TaxID=1032851 RepID=A0A3D4T2E4_9CORY|nr:Na+/H+ antiporter NhaA [Corynebacterium nuruki]
MTRAVRFLTTDRGGGVLLLVATVVALVWANSGLSGGYHGLRDAELGPAWADLHLSVGEWASDGLLAVFFFVTGLELKQEFLTGSLRRPQDALVPVLAACGGVATPALLYFLVNTVAADGDTAGWAVPAATDIAFAVSVLAVVGSHLPPRLRVFLLTLAVVDDLIGILIIAFFFADDLKLGYLLLALVPLAAFTWCTQRGHDRWWILAPLGVLTWALVHHSGIHATIAAVVLGFTVPVMSRRGSQTSLRFATALGPWSSLVVLPVFAFFAAGVTVGGWSGLTGSWTDPVAYGVIVALVVGKPLGITVATWLSSKIPGMALAPSLRWPDIIGMGMVAGIGFTVSLLISELTFGAGSSLDDHGKVGVLTGSVVSAVLGGTYLAVRDRHYRRIG